MRTVILTLSSLLLLAVLIGSAIIYFGLFNVSARGGHWPVVSWVLHTSFRQSVALRAPPASDVPALDDDDLVTLGARHYQLSCAVCHGEPDARQTRTMLSMLPAPPPIKEAVSDWEPNELFWIIKHGVKMTGMPHWPARERDDDIWPVVAFLERLSDLDNEQYKALLNSDNNSFAVAPLPASDAQPAAIHNCTLCHGASGTTDHAHVPRLDILSQEYLSATLKAYRDEERSSGIMQQAASLLDDETIDALADYYASTSPQSGGVLTTAEGSPSDGVDAMASSMERGRLLATGGAVPASSDTSLPSGAELPACNACHGPWPDPLSPDYPALASQPQQYLLAQLQLWKAGKRGGTPLARLMHKAVPELEYQQMVDLSAYYAGLPNKEGRSGDE